jgi:tubulin-specific chaperone D
MLNVSNSSNLYATSSPKARSGTDLSQLDRFQEWPQLLDPVLSKLVQAIVDGFLTYVTTRPSAYQQHAHNDQTNAIPLPLALSRVLYTLCKVRGYKVIVRLLNNEPRYVAPMLHALRQWDASRIRHGSIGVGWEENYIMLLWLSHLMLAPFELSTLSTSNDVLLDPALQTLAQGLPEVAVDVLAQGFQHISSPSKERESAVILLVRLALRRDMQAEQLAQKLVDYTARRLAEPSTETPVSVYDALGLLSLLYSILNLASDLETAPWLNRVFKTVRTLATSPHEHHKEIRNSAPARKLLVKVTRVSLTHAIALMDIKEDLSSEVVNGMLEDGIQVFLDALGDKDSPVRMASSKALSIVTLKLNSEMAAEIVEAVLESLSENILLVDPKRNHLIARTERPESETRDMKRDASAVDPLKWHGLMLTLGHLLFRRSPPSRMLPEIIEALLLGLEFEQRSNAGTSIGTGVRDAACFGIWSLSRKYSTQELQDITATSIAGRSGHGSAFGSAIALVAVRLMLSACYDPSGNIRRGSSAALQELIGRHPDIVAAGISVVQAVDYQAVARRSRAMTEVSVDAAALDRLYHKELLYALGGWRAARAADAESRRWAAQATGKLCGRADRSLNTQMVRSMLRDLRLLKTRNLGTTAGIRHGLLICTAAVLDNIHDLELSTLDVLRRSINEPPFQMLVGDLTGRVTGDIELVLEAAVSFLHALMQLHVRCNAQRPDSEPTLDATRLSQIWSAIDSWLLLCTRPQTVESCATAIAQAYVLCTKIGSHTDVASWIDASKSKRSDMISKGRLTSLAYIHSLADGQQKVQHDIVTFLADVANGPDPIETREVAVSRLGLLFERCSPSQFANLSFTQVQRALMAGLNDYTNDQRGDIGSLVRLASLDAIDMLCRKGDREALHALITDLVPLVVRLAAERLNKVRLKAWDTLRLCWQYLGWQPKLEATYAHVADVSQESYFSHLLPLLEVEHVRGQLVTGLATSVGGTTEDIGRACSDALVLFKTMHASDPQLVRQLILQPVLVALEEKATSDDHSVVPLIEFLVFLFEQDFVQGAWYDKETEQAKTLQQLVLKLHSPNSSMERLEPLVKLYRVLLSFTCFQPPAKDKLTRLLLHRYPKIRNAAADALYLEFEQKLLAERDWNAAAASNKPAVLELRKVLGVAKAAKAA